MPPATLHPHGSAGENEGKITLRASAFGCLRLGPSPFKKAPVWHLDAGLGSERAQCCVQHRVKLKDLPPDLSPSVKAAYSHP